MGLARAVAACQNESFVFEFLRRPAGDGKELVVLDRQECSQAEPEILSQHLIAAPCMVREDGRGDPRPLQLAEAAAITAAPEASTLTGGTIEASDSIPADGRSARTLLG